MKIKNMLSHGIKFRIMYQANHTLLSTPHKALVKRPLGSDRWSKNQRWMTQWKWLTPDYPFQRELIHWRADNWVSTESKGGGKEGGSEGIWLVKVLSLTNGWFIILYNGPLPSAPPAHWTHLLLGHNTGIILCDLWITYSTVYYVWYNTSVKIIYSRLSAEMCVLKIKFITED